MHTRLRPRPERSSVEHARVTRGAVRTIGIVGLLGVGLIHLLDLPATLHETPYIGWLTIALIASSVTGAAVLVHRPTRVAWTLAAAVTAATIIAFVISRTVGLPTATDDIGNWNEPLGVASLVCEGVIVGTAVWALKRHESGVAGPVHRRVAYRHTSRVAYQHTRGATTR
jgi:hypothetical protein